MKFIFTFFQSRRALSIFLLILMIFLLLKVLLHSRNPHKKNDAVAVEAAAVQIKSMPLSLETSGFIEPLKSVDVRSQITGTLKECYFNPGESVQAGQLLFSIDPAPYISTLQQAQAQLERDQAQLKSNVTDEKRLAQLVQNGYVSRQDYDHIQATAQMQAATVKDDLEKLRSAQIQMQYTQIRAAISGQTGNVTIKPGDLVTAASSTPLVTVNQINPVLVNFNLPQNKLGKLIRYQKKNSIKIEVWNESGHHLLGIGDLTFIDNTVNAQSGTILLKASVANDQHLMWPGLMVMVKVILTQQKNALVIPTQAIQMDEQGHFVYKIINKKAILRHVTVQQQVGNLSVVTKGLSAGDKVITVMPPGIENHMLVNVMNHPIG